MGLNSGRPADTRAFASENRPFFKVGFWKAGARSPSRTRAAREAFKDSVEGSQRRGEGGEGAEAELALLETVLEFLFVEGVLNANARRSPRLPPSSSPRRCLAVSEKNPPERLPFPGRTK